MSDDLAAGDRLGQLMRVGNVGGVVGHIEPSIRRFEVNDDDLMSCRQVGIHDMGADEARPPGNCDSHGFLP